MGSLFTEGDNENVIDIAGFHFLCVFFLLNGRVFA